MTAALHPNQYEVNEAWIVFQLNGTPIHTQHDGSFNCFCLMDAASCFLLGTELVPIAEIEPSQTRARQMLAAAWAKKGEFPRTLLMPRGQFPGIMKTEAQRLGIAVVDVPEHQLLVFIGEARDGYLEHMQELRHP